MNKTVIVLNSCFLLTGILCAQNPVLQKEPIPQIEEQIEQWTLLESQTNREKAAFCRRVIENYTQMKEYRIEAYEAESTDQPVHYEKLLRNQWKHQDLMKEAPLILKETKYPVASIPPYTLPELVVNAPEASTPEPARYQTESGFEVRLRLED